MGLLLERRGRVARGGHEACEAPAPILGHDVRDVAPAWIGRGARDHATHLKNRDVVGRLVDEPDVEDGGAPRVVVLGHEGHAPAPALGDLHHAGAPGRVARGLEQRGHVRGAAGEAVQLGVVVVVDEDVEGEHVPQRLGAAVADPGFG